MVERYIGIDIGAETLKLAELTRDGDALRWSGRALLAHDKEPVARLGEFLSDHGWGGLSGAAPRLIFYTTRRPRGARGAAGALFVWKRAATESASASRRRSPC